MDRTEAEYFYTFFDSSRAITDEQTALRVILRSFNRRLKALEERLPPVEEQKR